MTFPPRPTYFRALAWSAALGVTLGLGCSAQAQPPLGTAPSTPTVGRATAVADASPATSVDALKAQAIEAMKAGEFDLTQRLIHQAARVGQDPAMDRMADWVAQFGAQREAFLAQRRRSYDEQAEKSRALIDAGQDAYALSFASVAMAYTDDKDAFRALPWVEQLTARAVELAGKYESGEQWTKALRVFSNLASIDPANLQWKAEQKDAIRRVRLLALYTPDALKSLQEAEADDLKQVEQVVKPISERYEAEKKARAAAEGADGTVDSTADASSPATRPAADLAGPNPAQLDPDAKAQAAESVAATGDETADADTADADKADADGAGQADDDADVFRIDWRETVAGVNLRMLREALRQADGNYYRDVDPGDLLAGGLDAVRAVATTRGLEATFADLNDLARRDQFIAGVDDLLAELTADGPAPAGEGVLDALYLLNDRTLRLPEGVLVYEFADGAFGTLDDFTSMIWPADLAEFNKSTQGEFSGVGISIRSEGGELLVVSPLEDSPAYDAGIGAGDVIAAIDGKAAKGVSINQAVKIITGPTGTPVTLTIRHPGGESEDYELVRQTIKIESLKGWLRRPEGGWDYYIDPEQQIAYLRLSGFQKESGDAITAEIDRLNREGARAVILDLRNNPGGLLTSAVEIADDFLSDGLIVETKSDRGVEQAPPERATRSRDDLKVPVVVLTNQFSASASEIVSGALKDLHRALIVGERTFGKGSVQMLFPLDRRQAYLKLTTSHYFLAGGGRIHREPGSKTWGVEPDVKVEMTPEQMRDAIKVRQAMDVLRNANSAGRDEAATPDAVGADAGKADPAKPTDDAPAGAADLLKNDPQLSAGLLLLRLELAGDATVAKAG